MVKISVSSQKGGVGKSIITMALANRLAYQCGYKVLIVDCDVPQISILSNLRTELKLFEIIKSKKAGNNQLTTFEREWAKEFENSIAKHKTGIDVISIDDPRIKRNFRNIDSLSKEYDIILYDLPGTLKEVKLLQEMLRFNFVFIPIEPCSSSGSKSISTAAGLSILKDKYLPSTPVKLEEIFLFFNKVNPCSQRHKHEMSQLYLTAARRGFKFLTKSDDTPAFIDLKVLYQKEICTSLLFDTSNVLRYTKLESTIQLMIKIIRDGWEK